MIITDYYKMQEIKPLKSYRYDCVASTGKYPLFEAIAARSLDKRFFCYYNGVPESFSANAKRKTDMALTNAKSISSVYIPDLADHLKGYGDINNTNDALLFLFGEDYKQLEIFVARGYANNSIDLFHLFSDGELNEEMEQLKKQATDE